MVEGAGVLAPGMRKGRRKMELRLLAGVEWVGGLLLFFFFRVTILRFGDMNSITYVDNLSSKFIRPNGEVGISH